MSAAYEEKMNFLKSVISEDLLADALDWVRANLNPDDVFDEDDLRIWAKENGFEEVYDD